MVFLTHITCPYFPAATPSGALARGGVPPLGERMCQSPRSLNLLGGEELHATQFRARSCRFHVANWVVRRIAEHSLSVRDGVGLLSVKGDGRRTPLRHPTAARWRCNLMHGIKGSQKHPELT